MIFHYSDKYNMKQYQHTAAAAARPKPIVAESKPTYVEQQLMETVRRLALLTDQQGRQIRRLETELEMVKDVVKRR
jgi:hypothetical protein